MFGVAENLQSRRPQLKQGDCKALQTSNLRTEGTTCLIKAVTRKYSQATNSLGALLFTDELLTIIWQEKKRNMTCIYETLKV